MIGLVLFILFMIYMILVSALNSSVEVAVRFHPFDAEHTLPLYFLIFMFGLLGVAVTLLISVIDRASLNARNRKLQREADQLRGEITNLREIATLERDAE